MLNQTCIISSNIRFSSDEDGPNTWHKRKTFLTKLINDKSPDILCSQEGRQPQLQEFESLLPELSLIDNHRTWIARRMYPCIYLNLKKFNLQQSGDFWLSETPKIAGSKSFDSAFPRLCTWVKIQDKSSKKIFYVFNTHLDHLKGETRVKQARVLQEQIKLINQDGHPYLICGDFNEGPSEDVHQLLIQSPLIDPWIELKLPEETSFHRFQENFKNGKRIDWIVCTNEIEIPQIFLDKEINFPLFPSDHYPVIAHFSLKD